MFWNEVELKLIYEIHLVLDVCLFGHESVSLTSKQNSTKRLLRLRECLCVL
jgi:hypothetical protein